MLDERSSRDDPAIGTFDNLDRVAIMRLVQEKLHAAREQESCADCEGDGAKPCRADDGNVIWRCAPCQARRQRLTPPKPPADPDNGSYV